MDPSHRLVDKETKNGYKITTCNAVPIPTFNSTSVIMEKDMDDKKDDVYYSGWFYCYLRRGKFRWPEYIEFYRRLDKNIS